MRQLTAYEHGWLEVGEGRELAPHEAEALAAAEGLLPAGCLQWGHRRVKFTQFCGVVQVDGLQVEVLPKLTPYQTEAQQRDTLLTMLACTSDLEAVDTLGAGLATSRTTLLDLFIRHFAQLLERQLQQGLLRDYRDIDDTLDQVRGRINLVRQQRENLFKPQRLACRYSELIADIPVNRLLHSALRLVISLATSPLLAQQLHALRMRFGEVGTLAPHQRGPTAEQLNRMQSRYAPLVALAHLFWTASSWMPAPGASEAFSLLFRHEPPLRALHRQPPTAAGASSWAQADGARPAPLSGSRGQRPRSTLDEAGYQPTGRVQATGGHPRYQVEAHRRTGCPGRPLDGGSLPAGGLCQRLRL